MRISDWSSDVCSSDLLTVTNAPAAPTLVVADLEACEGSAVTFEIASPQGGVTYNWYDAATGGNLLHTGTTLTVDHATADMTWYIETVRSEEHTSALKSLLRNPYDVL